MGLVNPDKRAGDPASGLMGRPGVTVAAVQPSNDKVGDSHAKRANNKDRLSSKLINPQDSRDCGNEHNDPTNTTSQQ